MTRRAYIDQRLAEHRDYLHELLPEPIAELRRAISNEIAQEIETTATPSAV
jgi:hypothetical protein